MTLPFVVMKTSLIGLPFVCGLAAASMLVAVAGWLRAGSSPVRRRHRRLLLAAIDAGLALVTTAAIVNDYFAYFPSVGSLIGVRAADQASPTQVIRRLRLSAGVVVGQPGLSPPSPLLPARTDASHRSPQSARGLVELVRIPPTRSGFQTRTAQVYLPPAYFQVPRPALPVIELLHGTPGGPEDWTRAGGADVAADRYAAAHDGLAPVIVMPDPNGHWSSDTECVDGTEGRAETFLTVDVPAYVIATFGTRTDRRGWALAGSSEGGYCALDLTLRHPDRYATLVDIAGLDRPTFPGGALRLFRGDTGALALHDPRRLLATAAIRPPVAMWLATGTADGGVTASIRQIATEASAAGMDVRVDLMPGAHHTWRAFRHGFVQALPWVAQQFGLAPTIDPIPHRAGRGHTRRRPAVSRTT